MPTPSLFPLFYPAGTGTGSLVVLSDPDMAIDPGFTLEPDSAVVLSLVDEPTVDVIEEPVMTLDDDAVLEIDAEPTVSVDDEPEIVKDC